MTFLWLIVWLLSDTPQVLFHGEFVSGWNNWAITLVVCLAIDIFGGGRRAL